MFPVISSLSSFSSGLCQYRLMWKGLSCARSLLVRFDFRLSEREISKLSNERAYSWPYSKNSFGATSHVLCTCICLAMLSPVTSRAALRFLLDRSEERNWSEQRVWLTSLIKVNGRFTTINFIILLSCINLGCSNISEPNRHDECVCAIGLWLDLEQNLTDEDLHS